MGGMNVKSVLLHITVLITNIVCKTCWLFDDFESLGVNGVVTIYLHY